MFMCFIYKTIIQDLGRDWRFSGPVFHPGRVVISQHYHPDRLQLLLGNLQGLATSSRDSSCWHWTVPALASSFWHQIKTCFALLSAFYHSSGPCSNLRISIPFSPWQLFKYLKVGKTTVFILHLPSCLNNLSKIIASPIHLDTCLSLHSNGSMTLKCGV